MGGYLPEVRYQQHPKPLVQLGTNRTRFPNCATARGADQRILYQVFEQLSPRKRKWTSLLIHLHPSLPFLFFSVLFLFFSFLFLFFLSFSSSSSSFSFSFSILLPFFSSFFFLLCLYFLHRPAADCLLVVIHVCTVGTYALQSV